MKKCRLQLPSFNLQAQAAHLRLKMPMLLTVFLASLGSFAQTTFTWDSGPTADGGYSSTSHAISTVGGQSLRLTSSGGSVWHTSASFGPIKAGISGVHVISGSSNDLLTFTFDADNDGNFGDAFTLNSILIGELGLGTGTTIRLRPNGNNSLGEDFACDDASNYQTFTPANVANFTNITSLVVLNKDQNSAFFVLDNVQVSLPASNATPIVTAPTAPSGVIEDATNVALEDDMDVADTDGEDQTLSFTITGGTLTLDQSGNVGGDITYGGSGNGSSSFTAFGSLANLNSALDDAVFNPSAELNGTNVATISFTANDGQATSSLASVSFSIGAVNDAPSFALPGSPNQVVNEDAGAQTVSSFASSIHPGGGSDEASQSLTFNVSTNNDGLFSVLPAINSSTGNLTYTPAAHANGSASITVSLFDNGGGTDTSGDQIFTITVNSVNDAPSFALPGSPNQVVNEDAGAQTVSSFASSIHPGGGSDEASQSLTFNVSTNNDGLFSVLPAINSSTGNLTYTPAANVNGSATITVSLSDNGGGTDTSGDQIFTITVNSVNDAPSFALTGSPNQVVNEDAGAQTVSSFASSISTGGGLDEASQSLTFNVSTDNDDLFSVLPAINSSTGNLTYTPAAHANGSASITVSLSDNGGGTDTSGDQIFTITVNSVNDAPSFALPGSPNQVVNEDEGAQTVSSFASSISTGGGSDEASQSLTFNVSTDNDDLFSVLPAINSSTGNLTYTPAAHANGSATITVSLSDNGGGMDTSGEQIFTITVNSVNDAPSFTKGGNESSLEDGGTQVINGWATNLDKGSPAESSQKLIFTVSNDNNDLFSVQPTIDSMGTLRYTAAENASGVSKVNVSLRDDGGTANGGDDSFDTQNFTITITPVNDEPSFTKGENESVLEDAGKQIEAGWATHLDRGPQDEFDQSLSFTLSNDNNELFSVQPTIDSIGTLRYTPAVDANGLATVTVVLSDDGGTLNGGDDTYNTQTFTITVEAVNDSPSFILKEDPPVIKETDGAQTVTDFLTEIKLGGGEDEAHQVPTFILTQVGTTGNLDFVEIPYISPEGVLAYTPSKLTSGTATYEVVLTDDGIPAASSDIQVFTITVMGLPNNAPSLAIPLNDQVLSTGFGSNTMDLSGIFRDSDGDELVLSASSADENIVRVSLFNRMLTITEVGNGTTEITVTATDKFGSSVQGRFTVTVDLALSGIPDIEGIVSIYPNPTKGRMYLASTISPIQSVVLYDTFGKLIDGKAVQLQDRWEIDLGSFGKGVYLLKVQIEDTYLYHQVVKQ